MINSKLGDYQAIDTLGKSGAELVVKVYDGAISNLQKAADSYSSNNLQSGYEAMEKVKKFTVHLYTTLDMDKGGEIALNLSKLYAFIVEQINLIQATKNISAIEDLIRILENIRESWSQLAKQTRNRQENKSAGNSGPQPVKSLSVSV
ncbi:MAG: flagellar protein FliS [Candidatus Zixiibacteriota bacterium]|nr:MAG: flagellar protein FliS [candidate division Zixibacteria bacterium]